MKRLVPLLIAVLSACASPRETPLTEEDHKAIAEKLMLKIYDQAMDGFHDVKADSIVPAAGVVPAAFPPDSHETPTVRTLTDALHRRAACMDVHAENMGNAYTIGYKRRDSCGRNEPVVQFLQGPLEETRNQFDFAIDGEGLFKVTLSDSCIAYTRGGTFKIDAAGHLITTEGYLIDPQITIPSNAIEIRVDQKGNVFIVDPAAPDTLTQCGQMQLSRFVNPQRLETFRDTYFFQTADSGTPTDGTPGVKAQGFGSVRQGFVETSNVDMMRESIDMIQDIRAYKHLKGLLLKALDAGPMPEK